MASDLKKHVGARIRRARKEARLTQGELAERIGRVETTISNAERGQVAVSLETLQIIAEALRVEPSHFLAGFSVSTSGNNKSDNLLQELDLLVGRLSAKKLQLLVDVARAIDRS
jgi:transcriptional regulator with XRE-family HTH domain